MSKHILNIILSLIIISSFSCNEDIKTEETIIKQPILIDNHSGKIGLYKGKILNNEKTIESEEAFNDIDYIKNEDIISLIYSYQKEATKEKLYYSGKPIVQFQIENNLTHNKVYYYYIYKEENKIYFYYFNHGFKACEITKRDFETMINFLK